MPAFGTLPIDRIDELNGVLNAWHLPRVMTDDYLEETRKSHYQAVSSLCLAAIQCHQADRPINQMVYFCLLESLEVGGHALKLSDCYVVTIYAGAFERLRRLFLALVNHNEIRAAMKMPGERSVAKLSSQSVKMLLNLIIEMDWPEADEMDRWTATELATAAISTLTLHEYCHALKGHLDLLSSKAEKTLALNEVPLPLKNADEALTRRTLEWDADCFGAVQSWNAMLETRDIAKAVAIQKARGIFDETEYRVMRLSFFSISTYVLFRYFDSHGSHTDETHASHPAPAKRQWCSINTIGADLTKRGVISQKQFNDTLVPIVVAVETALRRGRRSAFRGDLRRMFENYYKQEDLSRRYAQLYPLLDKLKISPTFKLGKIN